LGFIFLLGICSWRTQIDDLLKRGILIIFCFCSKEKAKNAVLYHYKHAASGFSVKLTPQQVEELKSESPSLTIEL
jgi:hypothetical protein